MRLFKEDTIISMMLNITEVSVILFGMSTFGSFVLWINIINNYYETHWSLYCAQLIVLIFSICSLGTIVYFLCIKNRHLNNLTYMYVYNEYVRRIHINVFVLSLIINIVVSIVFGLEIYTQYNIVQKYGKSYYNIEEREHVFMLYKRYKQQEKYRQFTKTQLDLITIENEVINKFREKTL